MPACPDGLHCSFLLPTLTGLNVLQTGASQMLRLHTKLRPGEDNGERILLSARKYTDKSLRQNHAGSKLGHPPRDMPVSCDMASQDFLEQMKVLCGLTRKLTPLRWLPEPRSIWESGDTLRVPAFT